MGGAVDAKVAEVCQMERRVLITLDTDFADIRAYPPADHAGIVVLRLARQDKPRLIDVLQTLAPRFEQQSLTGTHWIVEEGGIRVRQ